MSDVVNIKGKPYMTVAGRVRKAHEELSENFEIVTEALPQEGGVLFKAIVSTPKGRFFGHSFASLTAQGIEGQSPYEVAETSAIGRALGFAGYGIVDGLATGDEIVKSEAGISTPLLKEHLCSKCGTAISEKVFSYSTANLGESLCMDCQKITKT